MPYSTNQNRALLNEGLQVLEQLPESLYRSVRPQYFSGSIGKHVRHILNFYESFFAGLETGRIDYDARRRDADVEASLPCALSRVRAMAEALAFLNLDLREPLWVRQNEGLDSGGEEDWSLSSIGRELQSLVSHTVHHFAIIALILRIHGVECPEEFGVAPSTLKYQRSLECAPSPG